MSYFILLTLLALFNSKASSGNTPQSYHGYKLLRIRTNNLRWLEEMERRAADLDCSSERERSLIDVWAEPNKFRDYSDVLVAPEFLDEFLQILKERGITDVNIIKREIQSEIDRQKREIQRANFRGKRSVPQSGDVEGFSLLAYHRYDKIVDHMKALAAKYPHLVRNFNLTKSFEGRDLIGIEIGKRAPFKPAIFIDAGIHAREWIAPAVALYVANKLATKYGKDEKITRMVDKFDWYLLPVANPDGYEYSMLKDRLWRKTRSRNLTVSTWCVGVDANRNWGYRWGEVDVNRNPCSHTYAGASPFSEVEVLAIKDFILWKIPDLKVYVSLHSYGQLFLAPWGYTRDKPDNYDDQKAAGEYALEAIKNKTGAEYKYGTISELMYPASGTSIDYMQSRGVPYIYGIELRPHDNDKDFGFTIPARYIEPTGEEMLSAFLTIAEYVAQAKML